MRKRLLKFTGIAIALGMIAAVLLHDSKRAAQWRFVGKAHVPDLNSAFSDLGKVLPPVETHASHILRGLPHGFYERKQFVHELWNSDNISIHGYRFYKAPWLHAEPLSQILERSLKNPASFTPYRGPKFCGGYHADFAVQFASASGPYWFLVCLGCKEVLCFSPNATLICDLDDSVYYPILDAWRAQNAVDKKAQPAHR